MTCVQSVETRPVPPEPILTSQVGLVLEPFSNKVGTFGRRKELLRVPGGAGAI